MPRCAVPGGSGEVGGTLLAVPPRLAAAQDQARPKLKAAASGSFHPSAGARKQGQFTRRKSWL